MERGGRNHEDSDDDVVVVVVVVDEGANTGVDGVTCRERPPV